MSYGVLVIVRSDKENGCIYTTASQLPCHEDDARSEHDVGPKLPTTRRAVQDVSQLGHEQQHQRQPESNDVYLRPAHCGVGIHPRHICRSRSVFTWLIAIQHTKSNEE